MQSGLLDTYRRPSRTRGGIAIAVSIALTVFYLLLYLPGSYYFPNFPDVLTPVATALYLPSKWFLYGLLYSLGMVVGGWFMLKKHGNSRYHRIRTYTLVGVQIALGFSLPLVLKVLNKPELYLSYFWPLDHVRLYPDSLAALPSYLAAYFVVGSLVAFPLLAYFKGKRFYCSWVCGCGGLAETFGDPWRHLSDKSARAWRFEQISINTVLALVLLLTGLTIADATSRSALVGEADPMVALSTSLAETAEHIRKSDASTLGAAVAEVRAETEAANPPPWLVEKLPPIEAKARAGDVAGTADEVKNLAYAAMPQSRVAAITRPLEGFYSFFIGAVFSGVLGVGLYPLMGSRVWCRFGCPMAAILGFFQKFGRFRVAVKKDMCISCGNCSTYCEMGIDVRAYAMANLDIKRQSCVGCGMCAHVCPRGVLQLVTKKDAGPGAHVQEWTLDL